jgi:hypothetical protein
VGFQNEKPAKGSTFDWDFAPIEKGYGEACIAGGGLLNMAMYKKDDLPKETTDGVGVLLGIFTQLSRSDNFKLPTLPIPCRLEGVELCYLKAHMIVLKYPPIDPQTYIRYLKKLYLKFKLLI